VPLVLVPTSYPQLSFADVAELGKVGLIICGNHAIRAAVAAMQSTFRRILAEGGIAGVEKRNRLCRGDLCVTRGRASAGAGEGISTLKGPSHNQLRSGQALPINRSSVTDRQIRPLPEFRSGDRPLAEVSRDLRRALRDHGGPETAISSGVSPFAGLWEYESRHTRWFDICASLVMINRAHLGRRRSVLGQFEL
jgi:hypothetical protein